MNALLAALIPIRDRRDRVTGYELSTAPAGERDVASAGDEHARRTLLVIPMYARLAGRSLLVPVTPALVHDGSLARFAATDVVFQIATETLDDATTRRAIERLHGQGVRVALDGFPEGDPLPPALAGALVSLDAHRVSSAVLGSRLRTLVDAGLRPLVRGVDDRATRLRVHAQGAAFHSGRPMIGGATHVVDRELQQSIVQATVMLAAFSDGRPPDAAFDRFVEEDPRLKGTLLRAVGSAAIGVRNPRSVSHALAMLGRDAVLDSMVAVTARLMGEASGDADLALSLLRRVRFCERLGSALDPAPHPRARMVAALLSGMEFVLAAPPAALEQGEFAGLPLSLRDALVTRTQPLGALLDLAEAMEYGWWSDLRTRCHALRVNPAVVADAYQEAWRTAREELATIAS